MGRTAKMKPSSIATGNSSFPFEPAPLFGGLLQNEAALASNHGKRIGILIVTDNAVTTFTKVLKRITPEVWNNVEEIAVFDNASQDHTYELAVGLKTLRVLPKLQVVRHPNNLGHYCPAKISEGHPNPLKISMITHGRSENDLNWKWQKPTC